MTTLLNQDPVDAGVKTTDYTIPSDRWARLKYLPFDLYLGAVSPGVNQGNYLNLTVAQVMISVNDVGLWYGAMHRHFTLTTGINNQTYYAIVRVPIVHNFTFSGFRTSNADTVNIMGVRNFQAGLSVAVINNGNNSDYYCYARNSSGGTRLDYVGPVYDFFCGYQSMNNPANRSINGNMSISPLAENYKKDVILKPGDQIKVPTTVNSAGGPRYYLEEFYI